ncbi:MAG: hypothetical protein V2I24_09420 [Halieaceae bacterium]|jgi:hypothetical protein|nr:hypothetical protein [Halieaceae bacterium]
MAGRRKMVQAELDLNALPPWLDQERWSDFFQSRIDIGKPMTPVAVKRMLKKLERLRADRQDIHALLDEAIINGWQDVYPREGSQRLPDVRVQVRQDYSDARPGETMEQYEARKKGEMQSGPRRESDGPARVHQLFGGGHGR